MLLVFSYDEVEVCHSCILKTRSSRVLLLHVYPFLPGRVPCQYYETQLLNFHCWYNLLFLILLDVEIL
jgi:hypothetical protein